MTDARKARSAAPHHSTKILDQCRDIVLIFSDSQISEMFENAGGALLDFAERSENNTIQGRFFEAMNLIQQKRPDIEYAFRQQITSGFANFGRIEPDSSQYDGESTDDSALSLVAPEEMEEDVASENLILRANARFFPELYALSQRLSVVNNGRKLKDRQIPAGPHHMVHSFRHSIRGMDVEIKIKIILYALFDKYILKQAKGIYDELNSTLKAEGILPNLKPTHAHPVAEGKGAASRRKAKDEASEAKEDGQQQQNDPHTELLDSIVDLMSARKPGRKSAKPVPAHIAEESAQQLVGALDTAQSQTTTQDVTEIIRTPGGVPSLEVDAAFLEKIKHTLNDERERALSQIDRENLSPINSDLIDLIGMLFEYMLNDPVLPNLAKALLSHLHTPYLKVALIDQRLLVDAQHPARRLLDNLVESGSLWIDEAHPERGIFPAMQRTVDRVLQDFSNDVALFEELLEAFEADMNEQQRRTNTTEQRTQEAARGREKLQLAKKRATHQIQLLLQNHPLPAPVIDFVSKTWLDQLVFILLRDKHGERGEAWQNAVELSERLAELFSPESNKSIRLNRIKGIPKLKEEISEAVQRMGSYSHSAVDVLFEYLNDPQTWTSKAYVKVASATETKGKAEPKRADDLPRLAEQEQMQPSEALSEQEQAVIKRLRKMKFGTWFEFASGAGVAPRRIKLSWLSPLTSTCMFVDRAGQQAEIKTLHELAQEILSGHAKVIPRPKHPFIERAMVSIQKMLGTEKEETSGQRKPAKS